MLENFHLKFLETSSYSQGVVTLNIGCWSYSKIIGISEYELWYSWFTFWIK